MSRFREHKARLAALLGEADWKVRLEAEITDQASAKGALNPLLALLARPLVRWQAAYGLGLAVPLMAKDSMESARVVMRRFMWGLNEESGNLGWGIPEAMACILAESPPLSGEYGRIFLSYGYDTGKEDNFLDHAPLRRGVYWGMGRIAQKNPLAVLAALPSLCKALDDEDRPIRGMAAWALGELAPRTPDGSFVPGDWSRAASALEEAGRTESDQGLEERVELFDGQAIVEPRMDELYQRAKAAIAARLGKAD